MEMKSRIILAAVFAGVLATAYSCEKDQTGKKSRTESYEYSFSVSQKDQAGLRSSLSGNSFLWEAGDKIGFFSGVSANEAGTVDESLSSASVSLSAPLQEGDKLYAYFPYAEGSFASGSVPVEIPASQSVAGGVFDADAMPAVARPLDITAAIAGGDNAQLNFVNIASVLVFNVYSTDPDKSGSVRSVLFESAGNALCGSGTVDITSDPEAATISGLSGNSVSTELDAPAALGSTREAAAQVPMVIAPGSFKGSVKVTLESGATYVYDIVNPFEIARGAVKPVGVDLARAKSGSIEGSGTEADPYIVHNASDLKSCMIGSSAEAPKYIKLGSNILISDSWSRDDFYGVLDGDGNTIGGLKSQFIKTLTGTVKNVRFIDVDMTSSIVNSNGIVAELVTNGLVSGVAVYGKLTSSSTAGNSDNSGFGGIAGRINEKTVIENSYVDVEMTVKAGNYCTGGIVGIITYSGGVVIRNCTFAGSITASNSVGATKIGGILGRKTNGSTGVKDIIEGCLVSGEIAIPNTGSNMIGGVFGALQGSNTNDQDANYVGGLTISKCAFTGTISAGNTVGGIAGVGCPATDCFVSGRIQGTSVQTNSTAGSAGIVAAAKGLVSNCLVAGSRISGNYNVGGVVSKRNANTPAIHGNVVLGAQIQDNGFSILGSSANLDPSDNYWHGVKRLDETTDYVTDGTVQSGTQFAAAPAQAGFESLGFDFTNTWAWDAEAGHPVLKNVGCAENVR